jgi:prephenate dehydrogenase
MRPTSLAVLGLGAIGGSVAWQARRQGVPTVVGFSPERSEGVQALRAGAITDIADSAEQATRGADFVVLAAPPHATLDLLGRLAALAGKALVTDVASVKLPILERARVVGLGQWFAGSHPFAGTHRSGWAGARGDMFRDAVVYVCSTGPEGENAARQVMHFWERVLEAHPVLIDAARHDRQLAWTSHLPQAVASALAHTLAAIDLDGASLGAGARDTTRLAAGGVDLWVEVLLMNRTELVKALERAGDDLGELKRLVAAGDAAGLRAFLERGARFRRTLEGPGGQRST